MGVAPTPVWSYNVSDAVRQSGTWNYGRELGDPEELLFILLVWNGVRLRKTKFFIDAQ